MQLNPTANSTRITIETGDLDVGDLVLWVPECINTNTGTCAVYPVGFWHGSSRKLHQMIPVETSIGPGNCPKIDVTTFECCGIRVPTDNPVEWRTHVVAEGDHVDFTIELTNLGNTPLQKAAAAICLKFLKASWWSDETTFACVDGEAVSIMQLGREAGRPNMFQAYLLKDQSFDHIFFREFWGFNAHRIDRALWISENSKAGVCVGIQSNTAYFIHSNKDNPCTDMMLAFGDIAGGKSAKATGTVLRRKGAAREQMMSMG